MCLAVPVRIKEMHDDHTATVELGSVDRRVSVLMTPEARKGDYVLLHTGYAISVLDPDEAAETLRLLEELLACADEGQALNEVH